MLKLQDWAAAALGGPYYPVVDPSPLLEEHAPPWRGGGSIWESDILDIHMDIHDIQSSDFLWISNTSHGYPYGYPWISISDF